MDLNRLILAKNDCYKAGSFFEPRGIMVHSTGANNPNLRRYIGPDDGRLGSNPNNNHWNQPMPDGQQKCAHAFIGRLANGKIATYQTLPWNIRGWHAGGNANNTHLGIEICEDALTDEEYFKNVYREAVEFCAYLCTVYRFDPLKDGVVICHCEGYTRGIASNHSDVLNWFPKFGKNMDDFRKDIYANIKREEDEVLSTMTVSLDGGEAKSISSIMREGLNYPNLRELMGLLGYYVVYDPQTKVVTIGEGK